MLVDINDPADLLRHIGPHEPPDDLDEPH